MRRTGWGLLAGILLCMGMVCACQRTQDEETETTVCFAQSCRGSFTENGYLRVDADSYIRYLDFKTGSEIALCNKEGCVHNSNTCNAYVGNIGGLSAFFYKDQLYIVSCEGTDSLNGMSLWRADKDGTARKEVVSGMPGYTLLNMELVEDTLYYVAPAAAEPEEGDHVEAVKQSEVLFRVNLSDYQTKEIESHPDKEGSQISNLSNVGGQLYYQVILPEQSPTQLYYEVLEDENADDTTYLEKLRELPTATQVVHYDPAADEKETLLEKQVFYENIEAFGGVSAQQSLLISGEGRQLFWYPQNQDVCTMNWRENAYVLDDNVLVVDGETGRFRIYDQEGTLLTDLENVFLQDADADANAEYYGRVGDKLYFSIGNDVGGVIGEVTISSLLQQKPDWSVIYDRSASL